MGQSQGLSAVARMPEKHVSMNSSDEPGGLLQRARSAWIRRGLAYICVLGWAVWVGGFLFYGGAVVPILHDTLDSLTAGGITRRVTLRLNGAGAAALTVWWVESWWNGPRRSRIRNLFVRGLLVASTLGLVVEMRLHQVMENRLDSGTLADFYPLHKIYLGVSTLQWLANLGILAGWLAPRRRTADRSTW